jgi:Tol biopolymer transport system component
VTSATGTVDAAQAQDGTLVYVKGAGSSGARILVWVDRQGHETPIGAPPGAYSQPRLSPDGTRIAVTAIDQDQDIWIWDLGRATPTRLTFDRGSDSTPVWMPDGRRVVFGSARATVAGITNLFSQAADGTGAVERLIASPNPEIPTGVSPDGRQVVLTEVSPKTGADVMTLTLDGPREVHPLVQTPFNENNGTVSPDGNWLAYQSNESGSIQVYVRPFPAVNSGRWQVSTSGGTQPLWAHSGQELFYFAPDGALMRVGVAAGLRWTASAPTKVLEGHYVVGSSLAGGNPFRNYDVTADGQRFLMTKTVGGEASDGPPEIVVVQHFDEELKRLVPTK